MVVVKEEENKRHLMVVVVVYSFTIHKAVLKKMSVGSLEGRCGRGWKGM